MRQGQIETKLMHLSVGEFSRAQPFQILIPEMYVSVSQWSSYSGESPRTNNFFLQGEKWSRAPPHHDELPD